jgi:hypothetical protein
MCGTDHGAGTAEQENPTLSRPLRGFSLDQFWRHHAGEARPAWRRFLQHVAEIKGTSQIENEHEYQLSLAAWGQACEKAVEVDEYMSATIVLIQREYERRLQ